MSPFFSASLVRAQYSENEGHKLSKSSLARDINQVARLRGTFKLRSGQFSNEYFDKYRFESDPALLKRIAQEMLKSIPTTTDILAGLELGGVPITTAMSLESGLPAVFVRKAAKEYGTCQAIEGRDISGQRIVLVEDVIMTGGAVADAIRLVQAAGGDILAVVCAIWRGNGPPHLVGFPNLNVLPALTKDDLNSP
jgi:orotate phosphoribosyltransferase